jgi:hypothetical protein
MWLIRKRGEQSYFSMIDDVNLLHLLRALEKSNEIYWKYTVLIRFFWIWMKKTISKTSFAFFSKHGLESGKLESLLQILSYNQYFFFVLKASTRANFSSTSFFKVAYLAEKSGIYCGRTTVFHAYFKTCPPKNV